jgi:hypothetical protein
MRDNNVVILLCNLAVTQPEETQTSMLNLVPFFLSATPGRAKNTPFNAMFHIFSW